MITVLIPERSVAYSQGEFQPVLEVRLLGVLELIQSTEISKVNDAGVNNALVTRDVVFHNS